MCPKIVFLLKTKVKTNRIERIRDRIWFANGLIILSRGRSGGLALLWTRETNLEIKRFGNHHIDAIVTETSSSFKWRITGFYSHLQTHMKQISWDLLAFLKDQFQLPWICFSDFNEILSIEEKSSGPLRSQGQMDNFRNVVNRCGFKDMGYVGPDFTWCNIDNFGFANGLIVLSRGRSSGLALLWTRETNLEIKRFSNHHIDAIVIETSPSFTRRITGFYGHP